jgi:hypothetical protein
VGDCSFRCSIFVSSLARTEEMARKLEARK